MHILVDIGNTYVVVAEYDKKLIRSYRLSVNPTMTSDEYGIYLDGMLKNEYEGVIISSITPSITNTFIEYFNHRELPTFMVGPGVKTGVNLAVNNPREVGTDLICNLATLIEEEHVIVVDFGTATTVCVMEKGSFKGVNITAGIRPIMEGLTNHTELLHRVELPPMSKTLGTDTESSIQIGVVRGHALMIEGMLNELKKPNSRVIFTGGFANVINMTLQNKYEVDGMLLLEGLNKIYLRNKR